MLADTRSAASATDDRSGSVPAAGSGPAAGRPGIGAGVCAGSRGASTLEDAGTGASTIRPASTSTPKLTIVVTAIASSLFGVIARSHLVNHDAPAIGRLGRDHREHAVD